MNNSIIEGDVLEVLKTFEDNHFDGLLADVPAGINFMGKNWDSNKGGRDKWIAWLAEVMAEALRVMKPGAYGLVWAIPRTSHWTAMALEDAGFIVRDVVTHLFGSGFPKSLAIDKAIDKRLGAEREVVGEYSDNNRKVPKHQNTHAAWEGNVTVKVTAPATPEAQTWGGWGTSLKPAAEFWILVQKPLDGTYAENALAWKTGGLNIERCRIGTTVETWPKSRSYAPGQMQPGHSGKTQATGTVPPGRFPSNLVLDAEASAALDEQTGVLKSGGGNKRSSNSGMWSGKRPMDWKCKPSEGGASRFFKVIEGNRAFYCAKASRRERNAGLEGFVMPRRDLTAEQREWLYGELRRYGVAVDADEGVA